MLMNEIVKDIKISWKYWIICHLSSLLYSLVCEVNFFKFSYSEGFHYTPGQTVFNIILFSCIFILLLKQIYNKKSVKLKILFNFTAAYILLYLLRLVHFHLLTCHQFVCKCLQRLLLNQLMQLKIDFLLRRKNS